MALIVKKFPVGRQLAIAMALAAGMWCNTSAANSVQAKLGTQTHQLVGEARLKVLLWNVFDARLYSEDGVFDANEPFALSLTYLRNLKGGDIVEKTMEEIMLQAPDLPESTLTTWEKALSALIPDVSKGTNITGVRTQSGDTTLYKDGIELGTIEDEQFTQAFFNIWLGENTSNQRLRNQLVGNSSEA